MEVVVFDHDEDGFKHWMDEHPDGYVLNCYRTGRVHSAHCKSYKSAGPHIKPRRNVRDAWRDIGWPRNPVCGILPHQRRRNHGARRRPC